MKTLKFLVGLLVVIFAQSVNAQKCYQATTPKEPLSQAEKNALLHMIDEEKLAHDVYVTFYDFYKLPVFNNISKSETRHYSVVAEMLDKYDIEYKKITETGKFINPKFEKLYNQLVEQGKKSVADALKVGVEIEDLDINDLNENLKVANSQDITVVFENIRRGSYHHMKAFTNVLKRYGETYSPKYITASEYEKIIQSK